MLLGEFNQKLSGQGRVLLPKKMREQITGHELILTKGFEKCLFGYAGDEWENIARDQLKSSVTNMNARDIRRYIFSGAGTTSLDTQGRFTIPSILINYAGIEEEVIVAGAGDHFEIWNPENWNKKLKEIENQIINTEFEQVRTS